MGGGTVRTRLELALRGALKARDATGAAALRSALAAIDNAGAVPSPGSNRIGTSSPHFAGAAAGLGAAETERRRLSETDLERIVRTEITDRLSAALDYDRAGHPATAARLRHEATTLASILDPPPN